MINRSQQYQAAITADARRIYIKAIVDLSDPDMVWGDFTATGSAPWSKPAEILNKETAAPLRYATLERNRWLLDGSFYLFPAGYQVEEEMGYCGSELSGNDGTFSTPQVIQQAFSSVDILQAFSLFFSSDEADGIPEDFTVEVLYNDTAYFTEEVTGNTASSVSFKEFTVYTPTSIRVTVTKWSLPGRRVRLVELIPGIFEEWGGSMLATFNATLQASFSCLTIPYGTVNLSMDNSDRRFEPRSKSGLFQSIEERQGVEIYIGVRLPTGVVDYKPLGIFYQAGEGWKTGDNSLSMAWSLVDIVGLVSNRAYLVPDTLPATLDGWIASVVAQLGEHFESFYHVDPGYAEAAVTATDAEAVTGKKCGDIIRWSCMAAGCWPRADAETGYLTVEPLWNQGNKVTLENLNSYPVMKANESLAALIFHLSDGTEYVVSGNATSAEKTVTIENPFIHTTAQALEAAKLILSCYGGNLYETTGRGDPSSEIGDVDTIWLDEAQATTARRMMQSFNIQQGVLQGCVSRLLQADGAFLYENMAVITESGTWKAPPGVSKLRVVLGDGGQGGGKGQNGSVRKTHRLDGAGFTASHGESGQDGLGGKIWTGTININPEQEFVVDIGQGGAPSETYGVPGNLGTATTFGPYSTSEGVVYPLGYTDIASGNSYGRTGVAAPVNGTGDGGKGGVGGDAGAGEWRQMDYHYPDGRVIKVWYFKQTKAPGPGQPGKRGANGFVVVYWDKEESA